ncbi:DUF1465 family protein [Hyphococcus sp.]|uniref:protease adaptor protein RcdA n=1 Tax=Hyphococcus sp. TaxID=2038636 RepID=UPI003CCBC498
MSINIKNIGETDARGAATFVSSEVFARTFREGMELVEETANYLDGEGRDASKELPRDAALSYAGASMRLTTQLMQIASWLLVLRAVREGEMGVGEAGETKYRLTPSEAASVSFKSDGLPERLITLIDEAHQLYTRISRLDGELFSARQVDEQKNDAAAQQRALFKAFGSRS